jgi:putative membrane protein
MYHDGWGWGPLIGMTMMLLFWIALIVGIVLLLRAAAGDSRTGVTRSQPAQDRALEILRERYARGEIDHDDYELRLRVLTQGPNSPGSGGPADA